MLIPLHLKKTYDMIHSAYPDGMAMDDYHALIHVLYEELSNRNIVDVIKFFVEKSEHELANDVLAVAAGDIDVRKSKIQDVIERLNNFGYQDWLQSE